MYSDTIQYESFDMSNNTHGEPAAVLGETPKAWDSVYTCNPKVIRGTFTNPLGDGKTYGYAMYYVALGDVAYGNNSIGRRLFQRWHSLEKISPADHLRGNADRLWRGPTGRL